MTIFREEATSTITVFQSIPLYRLNWNLKMFIRRKTSEQGKNQQRTQLSYAIRMESNLGHIGGRRALSPLRHPCSPKEVYDGKMRLNILTKDFFDLATAMWSNLLIA